MSRKKKKCSCPVSVTDSAILEKKKATDMVDKKKNSSRINIGDEVHRWKAQMMQLGMNSNELATFLMDR